MWNKFEPNYLKQKVMRLHGYLSEACKRCANTRAQPLFLEFLELAPPVFLETKMLSEKEDSDH
uniref:Uncharacterized protein n=1 Tax=Peronospora matthiolae TaxID=2874970 RepID=A0AAV1T5G9_9STRA